MHGNMPAHSPLSPMDPRIEMFQKGHPSDAFFNMKALAPRPVSNATEFDTDFEDDDSEIEDNSPRLSLNSSGRRSETTLSSFEEIHTPGPDQEFRGFNFDLGTKPPVEGPRGPHLFRASIDSNFEDDEVLGMSPMTPRPSTIQKAAYDAPRVPQIPNQHQHRHLSSLTNAVGDLNMNEVALWTPRQVAQWMYDAGFEPSIVDKFEENDISGAILITLKFEDLRELGILSFGQRTKVWNDIHVIRGSAPSTPKPPTPIDESVSPCVEIRRPSRQECGSEEEPRRRKSSRRRHRKRMHDPITPLESVSIVGIEQLMPKPHKCAKGENCSKWRKQQRLIDNFKKDHPVSPEGGSIWIAGDPGNPLTAPAVDIVRPVSDAVPSVVASSDVLGPGTVPAFRHLEEASLRNVQTRDPQENVKQFIRFQHMDPKQGQLSSEAPPSPPYDMFPPLPGPPTGLRGLPRLAIPPPRPAPPPRAASAQQPFSPYRMDRAEAMSPDLRNGNSQTPTVYRFGTPFSEMDVPVTAINLGPVSRDASQSVPPNMSYHHGPPPSSINTSPQRTLSRSSRRPSFALPRVDENISTAPATQTSFHPHHTQPLHSNSYWSSLHSQPHKQPQGQVSKTTDDITHAGSMRKRKTKMLRHEWHEHHFTLKGTRLAMHKDARALETLEYIDVDDYAIACSSLASGSKLNAAFKAMNISIGKEKERDAGAFAFQLVPQPHEKAGLGGRLRKRESKLSGHSNGSSMVESEGKDVGGKNKTHYFAVKSRDERIDWMRELMLAKALKQKSEGYEVNVNGNMI
jgi:Ni/Co efflux regulator RcnB